MAILKKYPPKRSLYTGRVHHPEPVVHKLEINATAQPWQKHDAKLRARTDSHLNWNERRMAREERRAQS